MSVTSYPNRLIEVDLPIARISAHARKEKSIKRGHISTLHIWWARRPLAACRAVICAALWPDPVDLSAWLEKGEEVPAGDSVIRPARFLDTAQNCMIDWGKRQLSKVSPESYPTFIKIQQGTTTFDDPAELRRALLDFIADFSNWDNSTDKVRFLLADDPGAGKTIMAGLLLKELKARGLVKRTLIVTPANLTFQWQREMRDKFREQFEIIRGDVLRSNYGQNPWQERDQAVTSISWVSRIEDARESLLRSQWDLIIVDEAHKMSAYASDKKTLAYQLGEKLSEMTDHYLLYDRNPS